MIAVLFSLGLFMFWAFVGYAIAGSRDSERFLFRVLLAPVLGMAATLVPIYLLNRGGLPIGPFAPWLAVTLLVAAALRFYFFRAAFPWREYAPIAGLLVLGFVLTGRPLFEFGFDWLSYCNDDMANYCLLAQRMMDHGYYRPPTIEELGTMSDTSQWYWFMTAAGGVRPGPEMMLAWATSLTTLTPQHLFMPVILSMHLMLLSSVGALTASVMNDRRAVCWTIALAAFSALTTLGTVYQLLGQLTGIPLLIASVAVVYRPFSPLEPHERWRTYAIAALLGTVFLMAYPEAIPFFGCGYLLYVGITWRSFGEEWPYRWRGVAATCIAASVTLQASLLAAFEFLASQRESGFTVRTDEVFPTYRLPSGLMQFWGIRTMNSLPEEPWTSIGIACGIVLFLLGAVVLVMMARRANPASLVAVVMAGVAAVLFVRGNGFGLFKLAMFVQPFLLSACATWCLAYLSPLAARRAMLALILLSVTGQQGYVHASRGQGTGAFVELGNPSGGRLIRELAEHGARHPGPVVLDAYNIVLCKYASLHLRHRPVYYSGGWAERLAESGTWSRDLVARDDCLRLGTWLETQYKQQKFQLNDGQGGVAPFASFELGRPALDLPGATFLTSTARNSALNRRWSGAEEGAITAYPLDSVRDTLLFHASELGGHYYLRRHGQPICLFQNEGDYFFSGRGMSGMGRFLLFEVLHPSDSVRFCLDFTATLSPTNDRHVPQAFAIGATREPFAVTGSGAARVVSPPFKTQLIDGRHYVAIDMGEDGQQFADVRRGLMRMYGQELPRDRRRLVGFLRDLSLLSEEDYRGFKPPSRLASFPADLAHRDLEFCGIYEDGWMSGAAYFRLGRPTSATQLTIRGDVPRFGGDFATELRVSVDGKEVGKQMLYAGPFELKLPVAAGSDRSRVDIAFSQTHALGPLDLRPSAGRLIEIGFSSANDLAAEKDETLRR